MKSSCVHDRGDRYQHPTKENSYAIKFDDKYSSCPFCKPAEEKLEGHTIIPFDELTGSLQKLKPAEKAEKTPEENPEAIMGVYPWPKSDKSEYARGWNEALYNVAAQKPLPSPGKEVEEIAEILYTYHRNRSCWISSTQLPWNKLNSGDFLKVKEQWIELATQALRAERAGVQGIPSHILDNHPGQIFKMQEKKIAALEATIKDCREDFGERMRGLEARNQELEKFVKCGCGKDENICRDCWQVLVDTKTVSLEAKARELEQEIKARNEFSQSDFNKNLLEGQIKELEAKLQEVLSVHAEMSTPLGLLPINSTGMREIVDYAVSLKSKLSAAVEALQEIEKQSGYEAEQAQHHFDLAKNLGLEPKFSYVSCVAGFERLKNQLKEALTRAGLGNDGVTPEGSV